MSAIQIGPAAYGIPETLPEDIEELRRRIERLKAGEISDIELRAFRVPQGIYEQRQSGRFMLRCRFPAGVVLPGQMRCLARVSRRFGDGVLHVTTRQDIQVHRVRLDDIYPALVALLEGGIACKGGGGNTARNVTGCVLAGVCAQEQFDVAPYVGAVTEFLLRDPISFQLPRKYKVAFAGCSRDCAGAIANDVGLIARRHDGRLGFAVYAGGGMGARSRLGELLEQFVPADQVHLVVEAIKRVFDAHGNRKNRHQARLRFFVEKAGFEAFRKLYQEKLAELRSDGIGRLKLTPIPNRPREDGGASDAGLSGAGSPTDGFEQWRSRSVLPQKQSGYCAVNIPLWLGDISADALESLADLVEQTGEGVLRTDQKQNMLLRWVPEAMLPAVHARLKTLGLAEPVMPVLRDLVVCTGAATCKLGICLSRGLAKAVRKAIEGKAAELEKIEGLSIHINGCPNACGRHPLGQIGLHGAARRVGGRLVPFYVLQLGARTGEGQTRLASGNLALPARNVPRLLAEYLEAFVQSPQFPHFHAFLDNGGRRLAEQLAEKYRHVPDFDEDKNFYYDWVLRGHCAGRPSTAGGPRGTAAKRSGVVEAVSSPFSGDGPGRELDRQTVAGGGGCGRQARRGNHLCAQGRRRAWPGGRGQGALRKHRVLASGRTAGKTWTRGYQGICRQWAGRANRPGGRRAIGSAEHAPGRRRAGLPRCGLSAQLCKDQDGTRSTGPRPGVGRVARRAGSAQRAGERSQGRARSARQGEDRRSLAPAGQEEALTAPLACWRDAGQSVRETLYLDQSAATPGRFGLLVTKQDGVVGQLGVEYCGLFASAHRAHHFS